MADKPMWNKAESRSAGVEVGAPKSDAQTPYPKHEVNREAFRVFADKLAAGQTPLTLEDLGSIFGTPFWVLIIYTLLDAREGARFLHMLANPPQQEQSRIVGAR